MNIKYHAQFLLDREKDNPTAKLRYRIKWDGNIVAFNLGYRVEVQKWSTETQRCKANTTHGNKKVSASVINRKIQLFESACEKTFQKYEIDDLIPNQDQFREWFNVEIGRTPKEELKSEKNFFEIYDMFVNEESINSQWNFRTLQKMKTQKKVLEEFDHDISFEKFNEQYLSKNEMEFYSEIPTVIIEKCIKKELTEENYKTLKDFIFNIPENITRYEINGY